MRRSFQSGSSQRRPLCLCLLLAARAVSRFVNGTQAYTSTSFTSATIGFNSSKRALSLGSCLIHLPVTCDNCFSYCLFHDTVFLSFFIINCLLHNNKGGEYPPSLFLLVLNASDTGKYLTFEVFKRSAAAC